ncbi:tail tubular protein B [Caulobacter phage Cd1]|uniref:Tail tubular protein B n=1 Tax=Caulobacter phage Cd1 TaxID=718008 RepID=F1ADR8_9CAUD|nr:tail tubular protein B [Caulobacter phage Cd1]
MGKVSGSYGSVVRGVSEQVPQDRRPGQHFEQVNMISDPVRGLARRHGSLLQDEKQIRQFDQGIWDAMVADTARHKEFTFFVDGVEYALIHRTTASPTPEVTGLSFAWCFNKDARKFIPIVYASNDPVLEQLRSGGVSAAVNVGRYIYLAGNNIVPRWTPNSKFDNTTNKSKLAFWVRGGTYSTKFSATLARADGTKVTATYKTKPSSYPGLLDTSDLASSDPDYQKKVLDRTNAYNSAVTAWIGEAAEDSTPENIANKLAAQFTSQGVTGVSVINSTVIVDNAQFVEASGDDGGDGTLMRAVGNEVTALDLVSTVHWGGKVVKVRPKKNNGEDAFYLQAELKEGNGPWGEVSWKETAGYEMKPVEVFVQGTVVGGTLYLASTAAKLTEIAGGVHPDYKANVVGDDISCPLPYFFGKSIDYLGMFQDRLVIGSGATLFFSRPGDYFNWFRTSVLTVDDRDPIEMYALGSEDDTIKTSTTYDRNILLFGKRMQYTVNGRQPLTPKSASIVILSAHEDAIDADPQNSGNFVFYGKWRNGVSSLHQIQMGMLADSPESFNVSQQLDQYLQGKPVQIVALTSPNTVVLRTDASRNTLYTYTYLDTPAGSERLFDAWSKWTWDETLGVVTALARHDGDILSFTLRKGVDRTGANRIWIAADRFVLDTQISDLPYADSLRPATAALSPGPDAFINTASTQFDDVGVAVFNRSHQYGFLGSTFGKLDEFTEQYGMEALPSMTVGVMYPSCVTPTNPYVLDRNEKAIVNGRLTLGRIGVSVTDTGGMTCDVETANGTSRTLNFNGRLLGRISDQIGRQPIVTTSVNATIGKEVRECKYTLGAKTWLPLTITAIEWTGQFFNNARRV